MDNLLVSIIKTIRESLLAAGIDGAIVHATIKLNMSGCETVLEVPITVVRSNDQAQRPPPETPGRLQESLTNYLNRPPDRRGGGSLQRSG